LGEEVSKASGDPTTMGTKKTTNHQVRPPAGCEASFLDSSQGLEKGRRISSGHDHPLVCAAGRKKEIEEGEVFPGKELAALTETG